MVWDQKNSLLSEIFFLNSALVPIEYAQLTSPCRGKVAFSATGRNNYTESTSKLPRT